MVYITEEMTTNGYHFTCIHSHKDFSLKIFDYILNKFDLTRLAVSLFIDDVSKTSLITLQHLGLKKK